MDKKIENFKKMSLKDQKKILLTVMGNAKHKFEGINKLYNTVSNVDDKNGLEVIKEEFVKIYTFLMEAVEYIKSKNMQESIGKLDAINRTLEEMKKQELKEKMEEDIGSILESQLEKL